VHPDADPRADVEMRADSFLAVHVDRAMNQARLVGADGEQGNVDRRTALADLLELRRIPVSAAK
jgi:hypothetical protein